MYAVIKSGAHQYRATVGSTLIVERLFQPVGTQVEIGDVYLIADGDEVLVGHPTLPEAKVYATIVEEFKGPKIRIFKYRPKERYRRRQGHRQTYMRLKVDKILKDANTAVEMVTTTEAMEEGA